jgi:uncharacterized membrane protein YfcA
MPAFTPWQWALAAACGLMVGIGKTGLPGVGFLAIPLFALILPARASTGALLPLLVLGDLFAVGWYRRHAVWSQLVRLLPLAALGVVIGFVAMGRIGDREMRYVMGAMVLALQAFGLWRSARSRSEPTGAGAWVFAAVMGVLAGFTTMVANAAGPVTLVYLLTMRLPKNQFLGTSAWFYLCINLFKIPFSVGLGLITPGSLLFDLLLAPAMVAGAFLGIFLARRLPEKGFNIAVQVLTAAAAVKLLI